MSINMDSSSGSDYSDFEHEIFTLESRIQPEDNELAEAQFKPFSNRGGLNNDEVAEIVAMRVTVSGGIDPTSDEGVTMSGELRGAFGANLDPNDLPDGPPNGTEGNEFVNRIERIDTVTSSGNSANADIGTQDEEGTFVTWDFHTDATGPNFYKDTRDMRGLYGRGPVLDASDELTYLGAHINNDGSDASLEAAFRVHLVYDVATVDGVRQSFSIPGRVE